MSLNFIHTIYNKSIMEHAIVIFIFLCYLNVQYFKCNDVFKLKKFRGLHQLKSFLFLL